MTVFSDAIFVVFGIYLVFNGLTSDTLIDESEGTASEEQRARLRTLRSSATYNPVSRACSSNMYPEWFAPDMRTWLCQQ
jgi:hypothetical protein